MSARPPFPPTPTRAPPKPPHTHPPVRQDRKLDSRRIKELHNIFAAYDRRGRGNKVVLRIPQPRNCERDRMGGVHVGGWVCGLEGGWVDGAGRWMWRAGGWMWRVSARGAGQGAVGVACAQVLSPLPPLPPSHPPPPLPPPLPPPTHPAPPTHPSAMRDNDAESAGAPGASRSEDPLKWVPLAPSLLPLPCVHAFGCLPSWRLLALMAGTRVCSRPPRPPAPLPPCTPPLPPCRPPLPCRELGDAGMVVRDPPTFHLLIHQVSILPACVCVCVCGLGRGRAWCE